MNCSNKKFHDSMRQPLRSLMPALKNKKYFNYGGQGPLPQPALEAIINSWNKIQDIGPFTNDVWPYISSEIQATKKHLARICGVEESHIALTENVTTGCIGPLWGLPLHQCDHILISDCEHPGIIAACKELARRKGLLIDILPLQHLRYGIDKQLLLEKEILSNIDRCIHSQTKLVVISHLLWNTGQVMPLKGIASRLSSHPNKPYLLVDAAQSFGQIPIQEACKYSDIYAFTGHKWAFGPEGLGGVALSSRVLQESDPTFIGWKSLKQEVGIYTNLKEPFHRDSRRFEVATSCVPLLAGLRTSLVLLESEGSEVERFLKIKSLSYKFWTELQGLNFYQTILLGPPPSGLISFSPKKNSLHNQIVKALGKKGLWIRVLEDPYWLRACVHITTLDSEIEQLISELYIFSKSFV